MLNQIYPADRYFTLILQIYSNIRKLTKYDKKVGHATDLLLSRSLLQPIPSVNKEIPLDRMGRDGMGWDGMG